jgi:hypothetical protein
VNPVKSPLYIVGKELVAAVLYDIDAYIQDCDHPLKVKGINVAERRLHGFGMGGHEALGSDSVGILPSF